MADDSLCDGVAGRIVLVVDAAVPAAVQQACADLAATLADQSGLPVTVAAVPIARLDALEDSLRRDPESERRGDAPRWRPDPRQLESARPRRDDGPAAC